MKKVFATLALLFVMSAMTFTPKTAQAADEDPCYWASYCGHPALTCDWNDFLFWHNHFCGSPDE